MDRAWIVHYSYSLRQQLCTIYKDLSVICFNTCAVLCEEGCTCSSGYVISTHVFAVYSVCWIKQKKYPSFELIICEPPVATGILPSFFCHVY